MTESPAEGHAASIEELQLETLRLAAIVSVLMIRLGLDHTHVTRSEMVSCGVHGKGLSCDQIDDETFCLRIIGQETTPPSTQVH